MAKLYRKMLPPSFMRSARACFLAGAAMTLSACNTMSGGFLAGSASTPPPTNALEADAALKKAASEDDGAVIDLEALSNGRTLFSAIPDPALPDASCGMILWTLDDQAPTPVLRYVIGKEAQMALAGALAPFEIVDTAGVSRYGVAEEQAFKGPGGLTLNVRISFGLGFDGGQYLERGIIVIEDAAGWKNVTPVAGLAGCRRK